MTLDLLVEIAGWIGAMSLLYAYAKVSSGGWSGKSAIFQVCNIVGSICFIINSGYHGAYPSVFVNIVWAAIGVRVLLLNRGRNAPLDASGA